ncbi:MAG: amino acid adenylation domain-containing protein [Vicinamibacterales bacterium]
MTAPSSGHTGVAVVGMSGRFPGAPSIESFWSSLVDGLEGISHLTEDEMRAAGVPPAALADPHYVKAAALLDDVEGFDAALFDYTPRHATIIDPQQRVFLECVWAALEHAGYGAGAPPRTGVYAGAGMHTYLVSRGRSLRTLVEAFGPYALAVENDKDHLATRVAYKLNLRGPAVTVQTACSTSLVAIHLASQSLLNGECDMAVAGGVAIRTPQRVGYRYQDGGIFSPDGHCRAFDADARGTVPGNGVGVVVLKRLGEAIADRDTIFAIVRGSAINNDGSQKLGYTAPSADGQAEVIAEGQAMAGVAADSIQYVEAHGTATPLGDPIEFEALTRVFRASTAARGSCAIGSVKTNVGHLDVAAGVAGFIKTVLALWHRTLPPSLHYRSPNPLIDMASSPFYVNTEARPWTARNGPRRAGVSSFGIGGTNAHVVLEEAPAVPASTASRPWQLLTLSARTPTALAAAGHQLADTLRRPDAPTLADTAYTLHVGRRLLAVRRFVVCQDRLAAAAALDAEGEIVEVTPGSKAEMLAMLFPGQGTQYAGMGRQLYAAEPAFRRVVDRCCEILRPHVRLDVRELLTNDSAGGDVSETDVAQPALFVVEYALAQSWLSWGVQPTALVGHSLGELVAACVAGVIGEEDALRLVALRGALMARLPRGAMLAVGLPRLQLEGWLPRSLELAADNAPSLCVVSGQEADVAEMERGLAARNVPHRRLRTSHAFHSPHMEPIIPEFERAVRRVSLSPPRIPFVSNVTGTWIAPAEAVDPAYWSRQMRQPVRFREAAAELLRQHGLLLEVGPGRSLASLLRAQPAFGTGHALCASLPADGDDAAEPSVLLAALGTLWAHGAAVDWPAFHAGESPRRVPLPHYPFEHTRHWIEADSGEGASPRTGVASEVPKVVPTPAAPATPPPPSPPLNRASRIDALLRTRVLNQFGVQARGRADATFMELGIDSLLLMQLSQGIKKLFGVEVPFRLMMEDVPSIEALALYIDTRLPAGATLPGDRPVVESAEGAGARATGRTPDSDAAGDRPADVVTGAETVLDVPLPAAATDVHTSDGTTVGAIVRRQLEVMAAQLEVLRRIEPREPATEPTRSSGPVVTPAPTPSPAAAADTAASGVFVPHRPFDLSERKGWSPARLAYLEWLIACVSARTAGSRQASERDRARHADSRWSMGFRFAWKDLIYPLVVVRSDGARIWDVDGREYIDLAMGFGVHMLGHNPPFVQRALMEQLQLGVHVGPQSALAGEVAALIHQLTGMDRAAFCTSGTEAVMSALRVARTVTGRDRVALFAGSYHGSSDEVLVRPRFGSGQLHAIPAAPGIPAARSEQTLLLPHGARQAIAAIEQQGSGLAAVLIEPVQGRRLDGQSREFLHDLRRVTRQTGALLVFDEMVTGFRIHPGGAQAWFGVDADLATYGKVVGGGMPIGVLAGRDRLLDAIDGGSWSFGDRSFPASIHTFHAGTFFKHPLSMAAARAVLTHLKEQGPGLQERLNALTGDLAARANDVLHRRAVPLRIVNFGSQFMFVYPPAAEMAELFFYHLLLHGVYVWEGRTCFLSAAHTPADVDRIVDAIDRTVGEMCAMGAFGEPAPGEPVAAVTAAPPVPDSVRTQPLSDMQRQIWLLAQMGADASCAYNECVALRIRGAIDVGTLRAAVQTLIARHDALRTTIAPDGSEQQIHAAASADVAYADLTSGPEEDRDRLTDEWIRAQMGTPFDFAVPPLMRVGVARRHTDDHVIVLICHHLIGDGQSNGLLLRELSALYSAAAAGREANLPPPPSFGEYLQARYDRESIGNSRAHEDYWRHQLADLPPPLDLPADWPRPAVKTYRAARVSRRLNDELADGIRRFSGAHGCTVFVTLLAAYGMLLQRLASQPDVIVSIPLGGRRGGIDDRVVGCCLHVAPLRLRTQPGDSVSRFIRRVKGMVLDAQEHQDYSYGRLLKAIAVPADPSRTPLVQASFNRDRLPRGRLFAADVEPYANPATHAKFDLELNVYDTDDELLFFADYNTSLFEPATVERWLACYAELLAGVVGNPETPLATVHMVPEDQQQTLVRWAQAGGAAVVPVETMPRLVERHAVERPDAIALLAAAEAVTFAALDGRSNQLARWLRRQGVRRGSCVGVCLDRSADAVVALLAVLKAGAAYVPLNPTDPDERVLFMLRDSGTAALVTEERLRGRFSAAPVPGLCVDSEWSVVAAESGAALGVAVDLDDIAYVIYTSGTTGIPKGCEVTHRNVCQYLAWADSYYCQAGCEGRFALFSSLASDLTVTSLFLPMTRGRTLYLCDSAHDIVESLQEVSESPGVDALKLTPSHVSALPLVEGDLSHVRLCIVGGEPLTPEHVRQLRQSIPQARIVNEYGPTETTVGCVSAEVDSHTRITIGRPIRNARVFVLDAAMNLVPAGVVGEIYIGGAGVSRGYRHRPVQTADRFLPDPYAFTPGATLYRSGDRGRWLPDGRLEFLGRSDEQIKVRGFRIEPAEIEVCLRQFPGVADAVAVAYEAAPADCRLAAYVVATADPPNVGELRRHVEQRLPDYMIPATFVFLPVLPLTPAGKLDRRALPPPTGERPRIEPSYAPPRTSMESLVCDIWSSVLGLERVGIDDNYFELGGDSLLATQVMSRIREHCGVSLPLRTLLEHPTAAALAAQLAAGAGEPSQPDEAIIVPAPPRDRYPLTFAQESLWVLERVAPPNAAYNASTALKLFGPLRTDALRQSLADVARRQQSLRTAFREIDGEPCQVIDPDVEVPLRIVDLSGSAPAERRAALAAVMAEQAAHPFSLAHAPLVRTTLYRFGPRHHVLQVVLHHIISDGWSEDVLLRELAAVYEAYCAGRPVALPPLPVQMTDVAVWQRAYLQGPVLDRLLDYWTTQLRGAPTTRWPADHPRPPAFTFRGEREDFKVPPAVADMARRRARERQATPYMVFVAALSALVGRVTGRDDIVLLADNAGRSRSAVEGLVGFFVNLLPLRIDLSGDPTFVELLARVREVALEADRHQDLPFDRLVAALRTSRDLSATPLSGINCSFQQAPFRDDAPLVRRVRETSVEVFTPTSKHDISLFMYPGGDEVRGAVVFNTDLYERSSIRSMIRLYKAVLRRSVEDSQVRVSQLDAIIADERRRERVGQAAALNERARSKLGGASRTPLVTG